MCVYMYIRMYIYIYKSLARELNHALVSQSESKDSNHPNVPSNSSVGVFKQWGATP